MRLTVHKKVGSTGAASPSSTDTVTAYGLFGEAVYAIVPLISPVEVLMLKPPGRFVAPYVRDHHWDRSPQSGEIQQPLPHLSGRQGL